MSRQGAGTSVPAPLAYLGGCMACVCGAAGPGCSVRPWAAARPLAVRAASLRLGASSRSPARPRHRPRAPQPGPPVPPAPYTPAAPAVLCVVVRRLDARPGPAGLASASNRSGLVVSVLSARPRRRPPAPWLGAMPRGALHTGGSSVPHSGVTVGGRLVRYGCGHCVKPSSPLLARALSPVKPTAPLLARNTCF